MRSKGFIYKQPSKYSSEHLLKGRALVDDLALGRFALLAGGTVGRSRWALLAHLLVQVEVLERWLARNAAQPVVERPVLRAVVDARVPVLVIAVYGLVGRAWQPIVDSVGGVGVGLVLRCRLRIYAAVHVKAELLVPRTPLAALAVDIEVRVLAATDALFAVEELLALGADPCIRLLRSPVELLVDCGWVTAVGHPVRI